MNTVGDQFQQQTKYERNRMPGKSLDWSSRPPLYKTYPECKVVRLAPFTPAQYSLYDALKNRRSIREYSGLSLELKHLSYLLWACTGISKVEGGHEFRTAPSAGALYPIETYLVINRAQDISSGLYHYNIQKHVLELLKEGDLSSDVAAAAMGQQMCADAPAVFIWSAVFGRMKWKYDQRAYRYIYLDAGHIAQNLALTAASLGLATCQIGALYDDEVNRLLGIDGKKESAIYMSIAGAAG